MSALIASDYVFLPTHPEHFSVQGLVQIISNIEEVQEMMNPGLKMGGIVINAYHGRRKLHKEVVSGLKKSYNGSLLKSIIRTNIDLSECTNQQESIFEYNPGSRGAEDYKALVKEIERKVKHAKG